MIVTLNTEKNFLEIFRDLLHFANNCAEGCHCIDDRYEITRARVQAWKTKVGQRSCEILLSGLDILQSGDFSDITLETVEEVTNLSFEGVEDAANWLGLWKYLLSSKNINDLSMERNAWLDADIGKHETVLSSESSELASVNIQFRGQLDWLTEDHQWKSMAISPFKSKIPNNLLYRFIAEPGIVDVELDSSPFQGFVPGLVDVRLTECNSLTDECIHSIIKIQSLRVLSLGSLQIKGSTLHLLTRLQKLERLDLVGCKNVPDSIINRIHNDCPDLKILFTKSDLIS